MNKILAAKGAVYGLALLTLIGASKHSNQNYQIGVRTNKLTGEVIAEEYQPGTTNFFPPLINDYHRLDTRNVNLEMMLIPAKDGKPKIDTRLNFKTKDGNDIKMNMVVTYRIDPTRGDYIIPNVAQSDEELREKVAWTVARSTPRDLFGELDTDKFYDAKHREEAAIKAKERLNEILSPLGVIVGKVAPGTYEFDKEFGQAIQDMKKSEADKLKTEAGILSQANKNQALLNDATGYKMTKTAEANGLFEQHRIMADAGLQKRLNDGMAIKKEADAEVAGIVAERKAMISAGGRTLVKMEIAKSLQGKEIQYYPAGGNTMQIQSTDMNRAFFETKGVQATIAEQQEKTQQQEVQPQKKK